MGLGSLVAGGGLRGLLCGEVAVGGGLGGGLGGGGDSSSQQTSMPAQQRAEFRLVLLGAAGVATVAWRAEHARGRAGYGCIRSR
jgi:hypothetical protein